MTDIESWNVGGPVQWLRRWSRERPDASFLRCSDGFITYREMEQWSDRTAYNLSGWGLRAGDRIAAFMDNRDEYIVTALAAAKLGAIFVPVNKYLKGSFLVHQLRGSGPRVIVTDASGAAVLRDVLEETPVELVLQVDQTSAGPRWPGADAAGFATFAHDVELAVGRHGAAGARPPAWRSDNDHLHVGDQRAVQRLPVPDRTDSVAHGPERAPRLHHPR